MTYSHMDQHMNPGGREREERGKGWAGRDRGVGRERLLCMGSCHYCYS